MQSRSAVDQALSSTINNAMVRQFLLMNLVKLDDNVKSDGTGSRFEWRINLAALKANYPAIQQAVCESVQYEKPCLFIRGKHSDYIQDDDVDRIKAHFTSAQFTSLPTSHWVHAEQPQAFIEVIEKFLIN
jgi:pimeloyl-ACP methyl ester carboxylesterase